MRARQAGVKPVSGGPLTELQTPQRLADAWKNAVGLGWQIPAGEELGDIVWHNGGTGGHFAFVGFVPARKVGIIVLANASKEVDTLGDWLLIAALEPLLKTPASTRPVPSGEQILDSYIEATGGAKAHSQIRTMIIRHKGSIGGLPVTHEFYMGGRSRYY
jgi:CubicO group peptidase (beta-lactamase class C family)